MRMKKGIIVLVITVLLSCMLIIPTNSKATDLTTPLYFGIQALYTNSTPNMGYSISNPNDGGDEIWNIVKYSSETSNDPTEVNVYCVTAGVGFTTTTEEGIKKSSYNRAYDMKTEKETIKGVNTILNNLVTGVSITKGENTVNSYDALLKLTDLLYVHGVSTEAQKTALLNAALSGAESVLSDDEIEAVQQATIWYFTNYEIGGVYDKYDDNAGWLYYTTDGLNYSNISGYNPTNVEPNNSVGVAKQQQAYLLYKYLIDTAIQNTVAGTTDNSTKLTLYASSLNNQEQPLMLIEKIPEEFDLALRKYITKVDGVAVPTRNPVVDTSTIEADKTATYSHRKDPIVVTTNSVVTYNLTIYNEGDIDGRATKIVDQLPTGLQFSKVVSGNFEQESYDTTTNKLILKRKNSNTTNLTAYNGGTTLSSETIEIECIVTATPDKTASKILTNVAWISEEVDEYGTVITTQTGKDRDSTPGSAPSVDKDSMSSYKGTTTESDLSKNIYYPGNEDDDDFEKLIINPNNDVFDLKLLKRITRINSQNVPERLKSVDITKLAAGTATTADYKMDKNPISVQKGDIVTYTFRIYNEGDIDGYAEEITENIPEGLEFVWSDKIGDELQNDTTLTTQEKIAVEFNQDYLWGIAALDGNNKVTKISTEYLGRFGGQKAPAEGEDNRVVVTANLIKAFDKTKSYTDTETDKNLDYREVSVMLKVVSDSITQNIIRNEAAITDDCDKDGNDVTDRDSKPDEWKKENSDKYYDDTNKWPVYKQDDEDYDNIILKHFDLALRKFITKIGSKEITSRIPKAHDNDKDGIINYAHPKDPLEVENGDIVTYTIRIYNEGEIDGYAKEITDDIPEGLEFLPNNELNKTMRWKMIDKDGKETTDVSKAVKITTDYLSKEQEKVAGANLLHAFDLSKAIGTTTNPEYKDVQVAFKVIEPATSERILINSAQISDDSDENGDSIDDKDSKPAEWNKDEDDQDIEKIKLTQFDLRLRKFITQIEDKEITTRVPKVSYNEEKKELVYNHPKNELDVVTGDVVTYTIRVYNEGKMDGYAKEIMDDMPDGLKFLPENETNKEYRWKMYREIEEDEKVDEEDKDKVITCGNKQYIEETEVDKADVIVTDYLSKEQEETAGDNLLKAFKPAVETSETNPSYKDVKVAFEVVEPNGSDKILVNSAQISEDSDENGDPVQDIDSKPGEWNEGEDDQDKEYVKLTYFDLALRKWVTQAIVIENGKETITQTGHTPEMDPEPAVKVELHKKKLSNVTVKFRYSIRITNEGDIAGYAKEITDYVPEGLKFVAEDNKGWKDEGNNIISTNLLKDKLLQPGEHADVEVVLTWINGQDNLSLKTNIAEISQDENDKGVPDKDSTPDNQKPGEDDIDDAPVILSITTGQVRIYFTLIFTILITIAGGIILIKKFVL